MDFEEIKNVIKKTLSEKRFNHSLAVMERCSELSKIYKVDENKAKLIGLTHDITKEKDYNEQIAIAKEYNVKFDEYELKNLSLMHAKTGAKMCKALFNFSEDMVKAIEEHTTGSKDMDKLSKILFVSDATGKDRNYSDVQYVRKLSENNIDEAIKYIVNFNVSSLKKEGKIVHPKSLEIIKNASDLFN